MIAAAVFVFNFLVNLRLKQINLPAYVLSTYGRDGLKLFWKYVPDDGSLRIETLDF